MGAPQTRAREIEPADFFGFSDPDDCLSRASDIQNFDVQFVSQLQLNGVVKELPFEV